MSEKKFSKKHEWVSLDGDTATVGITKHATEMLGDIVFVEVPDPSEIDTRWTNNQSTTSFGVWRNFNMSNQSFTSVF